MNLVLACLGPRWATHPEWPDIAAQAHLEAWRGYQRAGLHGAWLAAERAPTEWFRRWLGQAYRQGEARKAAIPFSQIGGRGDDGEAEPFEPAGEGFEASLLDRLEAEALLAGLSPLQRQVLTRLCYRQETHAECARALGRSVPAVSQAAYGPRKKRSR
jgi:DNA-directed RNA polymerase specialized sigma24 family protein